MNLLNLDEYINKFCGGDKARWENKLKAKMVRIYDRRVDYSDMTMTVLRTDHAHDVMIVSVEPFDPSLFPRKDS